MQFSLILLALGASAATAQYAGSPPPGCQATYNGVFAFIPTALSSSPAKRALSMSEILVKRAEACGTLATTLNNGVMLNQTGGLGEVVDNAQVQFDPGAQPGHVETSGWSICPNGSLALGPLFVFSQCNSGSFDNVYDFHDAKNAPPGSKCKLVTLDTFPCTPDGPVVSTPVFPPGAQGPAPATGSSAAGSTSTSSINVVTSASSSTATSSIATSSAATVATPYPVGNSSSPVVAATGSAPGATTTAATTTAATSAPAPSSFKGAADILAVGKTFVGVVAAAGAFFLL